jgi:hypothetical protein
MLLDFKNRPLFQCRPYIRRYILRGKILEKTLTKLSMIFFYSPKVSGKITKNKTTGHICTRSNRYIIFPSGMYQGAQIGKKGGCLLWAVFLITRVAQNFWSLFS